MLSGAREEMMQRANSASMGWIHDLEWSRNTKKKNASRTQGRYEHFMDAAMHHLKWAARHDEYLKRARGHPTGIVSENIRSRPVQNIKALRSN